MTFFPLICFSFPKSSRRTVPLPFENAQVANPCPEQTFRTGHRNLTFSTWNRQSLRGSWTELIRVRIVERRNKFDNELNILKYIYYLSLDDVAQMQDAVED